MNNLALAKEKLSKCTSLLIGAGAGIGKDSGLPDFRGNEGFWNNYPPYRNKFNFYQCANPYFLQTNPNLFWGFYGTRLQMYRQKQPHKGFHILKNMSNKMKNHFVVTSNVDGHFHRIFQQKSIYQVHGSIHYLQCYGCHEIIENKFIPKINTEQMSCENIPKCSKCKQNLRPNILMFNDWSWISDRTDQQSSQFKKFIKKINENESNEKLAIIQIGCGTAVPTIRNICENMYYNFKNSILIRINLDEDLENKWMDKQRYFPINQSALSALIKLNQQSSNSNS